MKWFGIGFLILIVFGFVFYYQGRVLVQKKDTLLAFTQTLPPQATPQKTITPQATKNPIAFQSAPIIQKTPTVSLNPDTVFWLINGYRNTQGKPALQKSNELCAIANSRVDGVMANWRSSYDNTKVGAHYGFAQSASSYSGTGVGENLYFNGTSEGMVLEGWKSSPRHNELLLATERGGTVINFGCVASKYSDIGSVTLLLVGDR